jgi:ABC-type transport system involved in multi-copper enzyme maturation permease subunit
MQLINAGNLALFGVSSVWLRPLWLVGLGAAIAVVVFVLLVALLTWAAPKVAAIARTTAKEAVSQPLFYVILVIGIFGLIFFPFVPYNTFGEDIKMLKDTSLTLIMILALILALWTASVSIADEIEGRTALTLLSKPVGRRQFMIGKYLGILGPVVILFIVFGAIFLASVSYKVVYDARETSRSDPTWQECEQEMLQIAPGLALAFMETAVLVSISVAISTRLPMMANLIICAAIYVLGHLLPMLANSALGQIEQVGFIAGLLAAILPVLEHFNIYTAIARGEEVPLAYLGLAGVYCLLYVGLAMMVALLLFEDRDLA